MTKKIEPYNNDISIDSFTYSNHCWILLYIYYDE